MAEENQLAVFEEDTPITPIHSQAPTMHAPPPPVSPAGVPPAHRGASPTHLPPPVSSGPHPAYSGGQPSSAADDRARIAVLESMVNQLVATMATNMAELSTVNQLAATMATNMAELMALLKGPNRASSSFTPPPGYGPAVDPSPWAQPTLIPDNGDTSAPMIVNAPAAHPVNNLPAPPASATMLEPPTLVPLPISTSVPISVSASVPAPTSAVPSPIIFLPTTAQAPAHTAEPPPYQAPQPHIGLSYQAPPPINIAYSEPGTPNHAAPRAPPTNFLPETGTEQEQRLKKGKHLHRLAVRYGKINMGILVQPLSYFFPGPPHIVGGTLDGPSSDSDSEPVDLPNICAVTEETTPGAYILLAQENEELNN
ncbi:hypothetical protein CDL15_Pgr016383 [Punica granatum]|uniref:Extensin-like n=1 Tax=Punica granatum TaxID=22663 RepID=A0A218W6L9_PUNGR|nr:hypothetical protein CDL15_Pgr016383 [Punica granatum]